MAGLGEILRAAFESVATSKEWGLIVASLALVAWIVYYIMRSEHARDKIDLDREAKLIDALGKMHEGIPAITAGVERLIDTTKSLDAIVEQNTRTTAILADKIGTLTEEVKEHREILDEHEEAINRLQKGVKYDG